LADIADLLPHADLVPLTETPPEDGLSRLLASLPVQLLPGAIPLTELSGLSPTHQSLIVTWASMLVGALAVAVLLQGVIALSERRASFVSAVTHELRTPLTTFRMYAEMLAEDMVPDEESRRRYLGTLRVEADRLTHLVENVLAYARLERGGPGGRIGPVSVSAILHQGGDRLGDRAAQAGLQLMVEADEATLAASALADASAVEQILFNLVDNACKYAASAKDRSLHLEADADHRHVHLRVRDHGPGVSSAQESRLFQPFRKSAADAAHSAPGVGLGLALSRRLARQMRGDLTYSANCEAGACFVLTLPRAPA
jgi:signal transduction histidine kinase